MKKLIAVLMAMVGLGAAAPAFAQHINPNPTTVTLTGPASLNGQPCTLTIGVTINSGGTTGTTGAGTNTGSGICPLITIDAGATLTATGWNATTGTLTGTISGLNIRIGGVTACTGSMSVTLKNNAATPPTGSVITISGSVGVCTATANFTSTLTGSM